MCGGINSCEIHMLQSLALQGVSFASQLNPSTTLVSIATSTLGITGLNSPLTRLRKCQKSSISINFYSNALEGDECPIYLWERWI